MSTTLAPIPLTPTLVRASDPRFRTVAAWRFAPTDAYVGEILASDIPQRSVFGRCSIWIYNNPEGETVGVGTVDVSDDYKSIATKNHLYIPVLSTNPSIKSKGYGTSIVRHLISEAIVIAAASHDCCRETLYLDVYADNSRAIGLYSSLGFVEIVGQRPDERQNNRPFIVMAKKVGPGC